MFALLHAQTKTTTPITKSTLVRPTKAAETPTAKPTQKPRYGGTLKLSDERDGPFFGYPPKQTSIMSQRQVAPAIETLFRLDKTGKLIPWLATGYAGNAAAKAVTLTIREGVKFHDGTDFNAEAVKWNLDQCMSARSGGTEKFKSIDIVNDYTVRINLIEWDNTITSQLNQTIGMMISPTAYKKNGEEWCANNPVGTGPFQFVSSEKDVRTVYKRFDGYWQKGKPYLDRIEWTPIMDSLTRQLSFRKGELDLALTVSPKDLAGFEKDGYVVTRRPAGSGTFSVIHDSANPKSPFANLKVRQASQYAIDTKAIAKTIFYGEVEPVNQWIYKGHWAFNPSIVGYPYNPAKAKQLLTEAGYPNGFKTKIIYITGTENDQLYAAVQGYLKAVGIDAELEPVQRIRYDQIALQGGKWEGLIHSGVMGIPDVAAALISRYMGGEKYYTQMLAPDDYQKALKNAIAAPDFKGKQKWTQEAMKLMIDKYCLRIVFCSRSDFAVKQPYLHNHGFFETPNTAWWTPEDAWLER
jgi:ABC-type transport system substrate-binding protein